MSLFFLVLLGGAFCAAWLVMPFLVFNLLSRVRRLERALSVQGQPQTVEESAPRKSAVASPRATIATEPDVYKPSPFVLWLQEDWLLKLGGLLLLIGFGWLTSYAFLNDWIGPMGRITLGIVAGIALLLLGTWRIRTFVHQGGVFLVIGSTTILLTIFAARQLYGFFTPATALAVMFLSCVFVAVNSVIYRSKPLSIASVLLAAVAPLLTNSPSTDALPLFWYLLIVVLGSVWIVAATHQREITAVALAVVALYSLPLLGNFQSPTLLLFAYAFAAIFFCTNTIGIVRAKGPISVYDLLTAAGNGLFLLAWILTSASPEWRSLILAAWMMVFVVGAFAAFQLTGKRAPFFVYSAVGVMLLGAATAVELGGAALTIAFTIECAAISLAAYAVLRDKVIAERTSALFVVPILMSLQSLNSYRWVTGVFHTDFFVLFTLAIALLFLWCFFTSVDVKSKDKRDSGMRPAFLVAGSFYAYALLWKSLHATLLSSDTAVMFSLFVYTIIGLVTYFFGRTKNNKGLSMYGGVLLGLVIVRLLLIDIWNMELAGRIVTFFVIGILLMTTAFFGKKHSSYPSRP